MTTKTRPRIHPEVERALLAIERATRTRLPALREALAPTSPDGEQGVNPALVARDLYTVARELDSLNSTVSRARRMGGVLVPGLR